LNTISQQIIDAALKLPEGERAAIVKRLLETLPPEVDDYEDAEWAAELDRRLDDFKQGKVDSVPWDDLKRDL
jgi:putative addiction module component (TIGR02574 family)